MNEFYLIHTTFGYEGFVLGISDSEKSARKIIRQHIRKDYSWHILNKERLILVNKHTYPNEEKYYKYLIRKIVNDFKDVKVEKIKLNEYNLISIYTE